jgi:RNA polymerase subunit RPABC4/transcription elongation factor Spt4
MICPHCTRSTPPFSTKCPSCTGEYSLLELWFLNLIYGIILLSGVSLILWGMWAVID